MGPNRLSVVTLIALLPAGSALAVTGGAPVHWAHDARAVRIAHPDIQDRLDRTAAWRGFTAENGRWQADWDEATRTPVRFWGEGWAVDGDALADDDAAWRVASGVLARTSDLLGDGFLVEDLQPLALDRRQDITTLSYAQTYAGLPVDGARVSLSFKNDRFVVGRFESMPGIARDLPAEPKATLTADDARRAAIDGLGWSPSQARMAGTPEVVVLPRLRDLDVRYDLAWRVELVSTAFPSRRVVRVDAHTGKLLAWDELVRHAQGSADVVIDDRYPGNGFATVGLPHARVSIQGDEVEADRLGSFDTEAPLPVDVSFEAGSDLFRVGNGDGSPLTRFGGTLQADGDAVVVDPAGALEGTALRHARAQLDAHHAAHRVRERALRIDPGFGWANRRPLVEVNVADGGCNAWYDGDIHFLDESNGCNNTARVADVVFHEYGHGFHVWSIIEGVGAFDGALSEGLGDYLAATMTGDPGTARGFFQANNRALRDIAPNRVWPDDIGEIHQTGIIIAGALWDLRTALVDQLGAVDGVDLADQFFLAVAARATDIPSAYVEALLLDDDNGDLADGTPNKCLIDDMFGLHGLGPAAPDAPFFAVAHDAPANPSADAGVTLRFEAALARPDCSTGEVGGVRLHWTDDADADLGDWTVLDVPALAGAFEVTLPPVEDGTFLRYRVEVIDGAGALAAALPTGSITDPWFGVWVGDWDEVFFADFEGDDGGFTSTLLEGDPDREGSNDWQWDIPRGQSGDPESAFSGDLVWGNDLAPEDNWNGAYQPNVHNVLASPVIDVGDASEVQLQFRRWLTVEDGYWDTAALRVNGRTVWTQRASPDEDDSGNHHQDTHWALRSYDVTDLVASDGTILVEWELITDGGLQLGGWTLDDVRVLARPGGSVADGDPVTGPDGFIGEGCACSTAPAPTNGAGAAVTLVLLAGVGLRRRRPVR